MSMKIARYYATATLLQNGEVLVADGAGTTGSETSAELYNPSTGTWTVTGSLHTGRYEHEATLLPNARFWSSGGRVKRATGQRGAVQPRHRQMDAHGRHAHHGLLLHSAPPERAGPYHRRWL